MESIIRKAADLNLQLYQKKGFIAGALLYVLWNALE